MEFSKHGQGTTSVVVHHKPGGASNFQLGGGYGDDKPDEKVSAKPGQGSYAKPQQQVSGVQIGGGYGDDKPSAGVAAKPGAIPAATEEE